MRCVVDRVEAHIVEGARAIAADWPRREAVAILPRGYVLLGVQAHGSIHTVRRELCVTALVDPKAKEQECLRVLLVKPGVPLGVDPSAVDFVGETMGLFVFWIRRASSTKALSMAILADVKAAIRDGAATARDEANALAHPAKRHPRRKIGPGLADVKAAIRDGAATARDEANALAHPAKRRPRRKIGPGLYEVKDGGRRK